MQTELLDMLQQLTYEKWIPLMEVLHEIFITCYISSVGSQKLVSLIFTFFRRDKKLNNFCQECPILLKVRQDYI